MTVPPYNHTLIILYIGISHHFSWGINSTKEIDLKIAGPKRSLSKVIQPAKAWSTQRCLRERPALPLKGLEISKRIWKARSEGSWLPKGAGVSGVELLQLLSRLTSGSSHQVPALRKSILLGGKTLWEKAGKRRAHFYSSPDLWGGALAPQVKIPYGQQWTWALHPSIFPMPNRDKEIRTNPQVFWWVRREDASICLVTAPESAK